jgi:hypothetical protein
MTRGLAWIAAVGLGGGIILIAIAYSLAGRDFVREAAWRGVLGDTCRETDAKADNVNPSERRWAWNGGDSVDIALPGTVRFRAGEGSDVIARGSPGMLAHVDVQGGKISSRCWRFGGSELEVVLPGRAFHRINISGSAKLSMAGLAQRDLELRVTGSGEVAAAGAVDHVTVSLTGSGNARLGDVVMKKLTAHITGSGDIEAAPTDVADIKISGSGDVRLRGHPATLRSHISGSGRITQTVAEEKR